MKDKFGFYLLVIILISLPIHSANIVKTLPLPGYWDGYYASRMIFEGKHLWIGDSYDGMVRCIDTLDGNVVDSFSTGLSDIYGLEFDGTNFWLPNVETYGPHYFLLFDSTGTIIDSLTNPVGSRYIGGFAFQDTSIWAARYYPNTQPNLFKVDTASLTITDSIQSPGLQPLGLTFDGSNLWVAMDDNDGDPEKVYSLNPQTGDTIISFDVPTTRPKGLAWDGEYLWLIAKHPDSTKGRLFKYDVASGMPEINLSNDFHNYGIIPLGDTGTWTLNYSNIGNGDLIIDSMVISGSGFNYTAAYPETLLPDSSSYAEVNFIPEHYGIHSETLRVYSNDPLNPVESAALTGEGYSSHQDIVIPESSHDFGQLWINAKRYWRMKIQNMGLQNLIVDSIKMSGTVFEVADTTPITVPATEEIETRVWYRPPTMGNHYDTLRIFSNDSLEPVVDVPVMGEAITVNFDSSGTSIWSYDAEGSFWEHIRSLKTIEDIDGDGWDEILASSENDTLYCIYGNTYNLGQTAWKFYDNPCYTERGLKTVPDLDGDSINDVIYGTVWGSRKIYALSGTDGSVIWEYDTHNYGDGGWVYEVSPFVDINSDSIIDILAATGNDGSNTGPRRIFCFDGSDGTMLWESQLSNYSGSGVRMITDITGDGIPEVAASSLDGSSSAYNVYLINGSNGTQKWVKNISSGAVWAVIPGTDANDDDTTDIIAVYNGGISALDTRNGNILWSSSVSGMPNEIINIGDVNGNGEPEVIPYGAGVSNLIAFDAYSGNITWSSSIAGDVYAVTEISDLNADGIEDLAVGTGYSDNYIYFINGVNGQIMHTISMGSPVESIHHYDDITGDGYKEIAAGLRNGLIKLLPTGDWSGIPVVEDKESASKFYVNRLSTGKLKIHFSPSSIQKGRIKIIDIQGRVLKEFDVKSKKRGLIEVDLSRYPSGIYHVMLKTPEKTFRRKTVLLN